jgi:hypothetical protein
MFECSFNLRSGSARTKNKIIRKLQQHEELLTAFQVKLLAKISGIKLVEGPFTMA